MALTEIQARAINGGIVTAVPGNLVGVSESPDSENVDPTDVLGATTRTGSSQFGVDGATAASGTKGMGLYPWTRNAGTFYAFVANGTLIYSVDSGSWLTVATAVSTDSIMQAANLNNYLVVVASGIAPQISTNGTSLAALGGTPPSLAKYATTFVQKVFLSGNPTAPNTIYWSKSNDPENWTATNDAGSGIIGDGDGDTIQGIQGTKRSLYVFKRQNSYVMIGDSPFNFEVSRLKNIGLVSQFGTATTGEGCFWASDSGIYYAQGAEVTRISDPIKATYDAISDKTTIALEVKGDKLYCFYKSSSSSTENDKCLVLAYARQMPDGGVRGVWGRYTPYAYSVAKAARDGNLYAVTAASSLQLWKIDTGDSPGSISCYWNTPDQDFGDDYAYKNLVRYFVTAKAPNSTTTLTIQFYNEAGSVGSQLTQTIGTTGSYQIVNGVPGGGASVTGRFLRMKMSWTGQLTVYGYKKYADIRVQNDVPRR